MVPREAEPCRGEGISALRHGPPRAIMKIFLSWSGERSRAVATALREWLPVMVPAAKPWVSHSDIDAGHRWSPEIATALEASDFGIICLTKENLSAPWILFES